MKLASFLVSAVVISFSGVMAPGPATAATILTGTQRRHAGLYVSLGHGLVEFPLMLLAVSGVVVLLKSLWVRATVGAVGGACLLLMGAGMLLSLRKPTPRAAKPTGRHPIWTGVIVTGGNPYFLLWWLTVGLALCTQAMEFGPWAFALFALLHWLCDLIWLETLSMASYKGSKLLGGKAMKGILAACGCALLLFGGKFIYGAAAELSAAR